MGSETTLLPHLDNTGLALNALVDRHEVLRASFDLENATLTIGPQGGFELSENDLSRLGGQLAEAQRDALLRDAAGAPFDLASSPLLRVLSLRLPEGRSAPEKRRDSIRFQTLAGAAASANCSSRLESRRCQIRNSRRRLGSAAIRRAADS